MYSCLEINFIAQHSSMEIEAFPEQPKTRDKNHGQKITAIASCTKKNTKSIVAKGN
jgi:hypothetical protein